ncbi:unnamed protein product [Rotaria socialis]|uniref:Uncharacterized protein n=1 Tax=Rotaria socialis TaxID=392032 RepID=A0A821UZ51_9BILA|nr:unnamed protein product [Rotaria socialis]
MSTHLKVGEKLCQKCFASLSNVLDDSFDLERMDIKFEEQLNDDQFSNAAENISTPSIEEHLHVKQSAKEELNAVFMVLHMEKIRDDRRQKKIREQVDSVHRYMQYLCGLLEDKDFNEVIDPNPHSISINESNQILQGVKELFKQSTWQEQIHLMTIAPHNWGRIELSQWFGSTDHHAREAILLRQDQYVLAYPEYCRGNMTLAEETIVSVVQFYLQDGVSRISSNTKDVLKINGELVPVRFMEMPIREALRTFYEDNPTAFNDYMNTKQLANTKLTKITVSNLIDLVICGTPVEDCFLGTCDQCNSITPSLILGHELGDSEDDEKCSWSLWKTSDKKVDLHQICGIFASLLDEIDEKWSNFLIHSYINREQRTYINELRTKSSCQSYAVAQMDFAENYTFLRQREVQAAHWNYQQVTLFTVHIKVGNEHKNMVLISDYMRHDTVFVHCAQGRIVDFLRNNYPQVTKISYLSDGAPAHFKNHSNIINLLYHQDDFAIFASWTFSASGHGKGPCDGIGAAVKSSANRAVLHSSTVFLSVEDFLKFTKKFNEDSAKSSQRNEPPSNVYFLQRDAIERNTRELLMERWNKTRGRAKGIRTYHQFDPQNDGCMLCRRTSNSMETDQFYLQKEHKTEEKLLLLRQVNTFQDIAVQNFVIIEHNDIRYLAQILEVDLVKENLLIQSYKPPFPIQSHYTNLVKFRKNLNIDLQDVIACLLVEPTIGKRGQLTLSREQFIEIQNFSR